MGQEETEVRYIPVYCDLNTSSILSAGMGRTVDVAVSLTSSGEKVRISMVVIREE